MEWATMKSSKLKVYKDQTVVRCEHGIWTVRNLS